MRIKFFIEYRIPPEQQAFPNPDKTPTETQPTPWQICTPGTLLPSRRFDSGRSYAMSLINRY
jgi:hypothetical protein